MKKLIILPEAKADLAHAFGWYEEQQAGLGGEFLDQVSATFGRIQAHPQMYPQVEADIRRTFTRRFPYAVYLLVETEIYILAVLHQKRNPRTWQSRSHGP